MQMLTEINGILERLKKLQAEFEALKQFTEQFYVLSKNYLESRSGSSKSGYGHLEGAKHETPFVVRN